MRQEMRDDLRRENLRYLLRWFTLTVVGFFLVLSLAVASSFLTTNVNLVRLRILASGVMITLVPMLSLIEPARLRCLAPDEPRMLGCLNRSRALVLLALLLVALLIAPWFVRNEASPPRGFWVAGYSVYGVFHVLQVLVVVLVLRSMARQIRDPLGGRSTTLAAWFRQTAESLLAGPPRRSSRP